MPTTHVLSLLLALSIAVHIGSATAYLARRAGSSPPASVLAAGSAAASAIALYLSSVTAYR
ncbi:hypothetical protein ACIREE_38460 [Streptomyces sp. NPDC102467]|uniref:hypothetical protein n=1 Tax=Streptomyces sp. NPDC102467 TaxID=3366179 RepID=UPI00380F0E46